MIIIGYPGIGKSSNSGIHPVMIENEGCWMGYIDLESHNFWNEYDNPYDAEHRRRRDRDPLWYETYCKIAKDLSNQGYRVFVSSHADVQKELRKYTDGDIIVCYPHESLKQSWLLKLRERYIQSNWMNDTNVDKNLKALEAAVENFDRDVDAMRNSGFPTLEITDMNYDLRYLIEDFYNLREHWYE